MDVSGSPHRGVLRADDMARWQPTVEAPLTYDYGRYTVCKAGVWSQGPVMLQQLALLKGFELDGLDPAGPGLHPPAGRSRQARLRRPRDILRRSRLRRGPDRDAAVGRLQRRAPQADLEGQGLARFPSPARSKALARCVKLRRAEGHREAVGAMGAGEPTVGRFGEVRGDTVHFDIIDQAGNMISATPSGGWLQSSPVIPELGFCLGSRAQMFWLEEDHPAALAPGKRPRTTLSPDHGAARRRAVHGLGLARRRPAGPVDHAVLPAPRSRQHEPAGSDRRAGLAFRAFPDLVLAAHLAARRAGGREPRAEGDRRYPEEPRPYRRDRPRLVGGPPHRRLEASAAAAAPPPIPAACRATRPDGRARDDLVDHRPRQRHRPVRHRGRDANSSRSARACRISPPASAASPPRRWSIPFTASTA